MRFCFVKVFAFPDTLDNYGVIVIITVKCPNTSYLSVFSPNQRKYGPEITPYLATFHAVYSSTS